MADGFNDRFPGEVDVESRLETARNIGDIVLQASRLTDDFSNIQRIPRLADGRRESDVEHTWLLEMVAPAISERYYPHLNQDKIRRYAKVHDTIELEVGDVATFNLSTAQLELKDQRERAAKAVVLKRLAAISPQLAEDLEEYEAQACSEARFVRMVDKLLPHAVDITGDGVRIMREDFGMRDNNQLARSHQQIFARIRDKFGREFPDLVASYVILATDFEVKFAAAPDEVLDLKEHVRGPVETERKFVIDQLPADLDLATTPHATLEQGYLAVHDDGSETRIRSIDDERFELTVKSAGTMQRPEEKLSLPRSLFEIMWAQTEGMRIYKTRYRIPYDEYLIELDIYGGELDGFMTAEIEFHGRPEDAAVKAITFDEPPDWFGADVSFDPLYKNHNLAAYGLPREPLDLGSKQV